MQKRVKHAANAPVMRLFLTVGILRCLEDGLLFRELFIVYNKINITARLGKRQARLSEVHLIQAPR